MYAGERGRGGGNMHFIIIVKITEAAAAAVTATAVMVPHANFSHANGLRERHRSARSASVACPRSSLRCLRPAVDVAAALRAAMYDPLRSAWRISRTGYPVAARPHPRTNPRSRDASPSSRVSPSSDSREISRDIEEWYREWRAPFEPPGIRCAWEKRQGKSKTRDNDV